MTRDEARTILYGMLPQGCDTRAVTDEGREDFRKAVDTILSITNHPCAYALPDEIEVALKDFMRMSEVNNLPDGARGPVKIYLGQFCEFLKVKPVTEPMPLVLASTTA
jgi:hypothetical protein